MEKRLTRNMRGKMIGGVAAGLADYLDIDATIVRLLFVLATFFHGSGLLVYIVLWIAMPAGSTYSAWSGQSAGSSPGSPSSAASGSAEPPLQNPVQRPVESESSGRRSAAVIGWILVGLGIFFLMDEFLEPWFRDFFYWFNFRRIWPVVFIIVGVLIISSATKKAAGQHPGEGSADPDNSPGPHSTPGPHNTPGPGSAPDPRNSPDPSAPRSSSGPIVGPGPSAPRRSPGYTGPSGKTTTPEQGNNPSTPGSGPAASQNKPPVPGEESSDDPGNSDKI